MNHDQTASRLPASHIHIDIKRDEEIPVHRRSYSWLPWFIVAGVLLTAAREGGWL